MRVGGALGVVSLMTCYGATQGVRTARMEMHPPRSHSAREVAAAALPGLQDVRFRASDGVELAAWYVPSKNRAAVLLGHGWGANRSELVPQARALTEEGFGVLLLDWRAHGESGGDLCTWGDRERRDVSAAIDFVSARPEVDPGRIGGLGFSMGAASMILGAAQDPRLRSLMLEATVSSLEEYAALDPPRLGPISTRPLLAAVRRAGVDVDAVRPIDLVGRFAPGNLLLLYGDKDRWIPPAMLQKMRSAVRAPEQVWVVPGAGHGGCREAAGAAYFQRMIAFFRAALLAGA